jgi:hypothetical protein
MYRPHLSVPLAAIVAGIAGVSSAHATVRVGYAMMVERNVSGTLSGQQRKVLKGDDIFENDFIRTDVESSARLLFVDKTQLMLGPTAIAKLDRLVFNPDQFASALTVSASQGAIRWISGKSPSNAYQVETSTVTIRPHGTMFDMLVEPQRTTVVLQEGIIEVCLIRAPQRCRVLSQRGELITATPNAIEAPQPGGPGSSDFEDRCLSAAGKGCVIGISVNPPAGPSQKPQKRAEPRPPSNYPTPVTSVPPVDWTPEVKAGPDPVIVDPPIVPPPIITIYPWPPKPPQTPPDKVIYPWPPKPPQTPPDKVIYPWPPKPPQTPPDKGITIRPPKPPQTPGPDKGKDSAGVYKNNSQMRGTLDGPRLRVNRDVARAHASVESVKSSTRAMANGTAPRVISMVPRQSFTPIGPRRMGVMGAPRLPFGGMRMRSSGFRLN